MTTAGHIQQPASRGTHNRAGELSAVLGAAGMAALVWAWMLTTSIDPPNWVRAPGLMLLPFGSLGSLSAGAVGLLTPPRRWAAVGLTLGCLTLVGLLLLELRYES
jgi:hypothetical protein